MRGLKKIVRDAPRATPAGIGIGVGVGVGVEAPEKKKAAARDDAMSQLMVGWGDASYNRFDLMSLKGAPQFRIVKGVN